MTALLTDITLMLIIIQFLISPGKTIKHLESAPTHACTNTYKLHYDQCCLLQHFYPGNELSRVLCALNVFICRDTAGPIWWKIDGILNIEELTTATIISVLPPLVPWTKRLSYAYPASWSNQLFQTHDSDLTDDSWSAPDTGQDMRRTRNMRYKLHTHCSMLLTRNNFKFPPTISSSVGVLVWSGDVPYYCYQLWRYTTMSDQHCPLHPY